jgi:hypothetical protein
MSLYIVTLAEMKAELGLSDTADDAVLTRWMNGLQGRFDDECGRGLLRSADLEEILDGGESFLFLSRFPVESVASVHVAADQDWSDANRLAASDYILNKGRGRLMPAGIGAQWPQGAQNIRVVYTGGFVACDGTPAAGQSAMPETIRRAFVMQLGFEWRNRLELGKSSVAVQGQSVQIAEAKLMPDVREALSAYRRIC